ncbi:MAG: PAS domain S-box protein [Desulfobacula sp.]|jgi:PAS domain S-box-containing protein
MRLHIIILILAAIAIVLASLGGVLYYYSFRTAALEKIETQARARLDLLADQVSSYLLEHRKPCYTLSGMKELSAMLENPNPDTMDKANEILDQFTSSLSIEVSYLMDRNGITICSSNRNTEGSFVGHDFSFRPYFQGAIQGTPSIFLAIGTTSRIRGVYHAQPIYNHNSTRVIGVAVIKASIEFVEKKLFQDSDEILLFIDPNGVVFITNKDEYRYKLLWKVDETILDYIGYTKQFGTGPWPWAGFSRDRDGQVVDTGRDRYLFSSLNITDYPGWEIISLNNYKYIEKLLSEPFIRVIIPIIAVLLFTGALVLVFYKLGINEIAQRKTAETELRLSEERYRHIYHHTPVMLHSIDREGTIIHVSDHWVEVMGYTREEVVGRPLIRFFTPESQEYALNVVFPEFFTTGFCKDISYTYIKKSGETMDIMLSCFGVRDENGLIVRSLAVSVDVTEKNRAQKELQIAKEKLSRHSLDLEQQVRIRTAQLEQAQTNLKNLSKNIIASQEREKSQVARELHDHLGQVLTALRIDAVRIGKILSDVDSDAQNSAIKMCTLIDDTINDVRAMAYRLRPRVLDDLGLADALESLLIDFEKRSNVSCVFKRGFIPKIDDTLATALYRIGQEAVTNALKHSNANTIMVELSTHPEGIVLTIQDNGSGFDINTLKASDGFGLEGMKERAGLVGGSLAISSQKGTGTTISCTVGLTAGLTVELKG